MTRYVLRCAEAFDLKGTWGFCWSLSCSKARIEAFSGGGLVVNLTARETVASIDCADWLAQPRLPPAAKSLVGRGLMRIDVSRSIPQLFFTDAGIAALRLMMADRRFADPVRFAHVRRELGIDPDVETKAAE